MNSTTSALNYFLSLRFNHLDGVHTPVLAVFKEHHVGMEDSHITLRITSFCLNIEQETITRNTLAEENELQPDFKPLRVYGRFSARVLGFRLRRSTIRLSTRHALYFNFAKYKPIWPLVVWHTNSRRASADVLMR